MVYNTVTDRVSCISFWLLFSFLTQLPELGLMGIAREFSRRRSFNLEISPLYLFLSEYHSWASVSPRWGLVSSCTGSGLLLYGIYIVSLTIS